MPVKELRTLRRLVMRDTRKLAPFNEEARELRILNKRLWLYQRDVLAPYSREEREIDSVDEVPDDQVETIVYRDNLFFDQAFIDHFLRRARRLGKACQVAFSSDDPAIRIHALPLQSGIRPDKSFTEGKLLVADLWYFPRGRDTKVRPLVVDTLSQEIGYYNVPKYMAPSQGDLTYQVPRRAFLSIEHWIHVFLANTTFGVFAEGARFEKRMERAMPKVKLIWRALIERNNVLSHSQVVKLGKDVRIDASAVIRGPTTIGDNVFIGPGAVIDNSIIGSNVSIGQGCQVMLSVVGDGSFLPFRASLFMTTLMENSMVAQNTCLQMCVVGRDSFIGAGSTFTDFSLLPRPIKTFYQDRLVEINLPVIGGCVGHNCRLGSGLIMFPARTIESDVILVGSRAEKVLTHNVTYAESDHWQLPNGAELHPPYYH
jgi:UDP-N-acetylglucosamine diphosphorylase / glucose-1-phosphate thymidylyltransferase / UDP-N-acetylgalactosamine diphosphorylase / glucosamine-1-phosphate N-acetyltransferase / galactosamine-1-phosphate N-acetyltransferase